MNCCCTRRAETPTRGRYDCNAYTALWWFGCQNETAPLRVVRYSQCIGVRYGWMTYDHAVRMNVRRTYVCCVRQWIVDSLENYRKFWKIAPRHLNEKKPSNIFLACLLAFFLFLYSFVLHTLSERWWNHKNILSNINIHMLYICFSQNVKNGNLGRIIIVCLFFFLNIRC